MYDELLGKCTLNEFKQSCATVLKDITICLIPKSEKVTDKSKRLELLSTLHSDPVFGGHCGHKRLYANLKSRYYWPKMKKHIRTFSDKFHVCKLSKLGCKNKEALRLTETPSKPFDLVQIDTIGPMRCKSLMGNLYAVTMICELTKYLITVPIVDKSSKSVADAIYSNFILIHGAKKT